MNLRPLMAGLGLLAAACATVAPSAPSAPTGPAMPEGILDLGGDWRRASVGGVLERFQREVSNRYAASLPLNVAAGDLRRQDFNCAGGRAENAPAQVCRKTETVGDCTHTWQVHLFAADAALARTRALYDRRCGGDALLGGPG